MQAVSICAIDNQRVRKRNIKTVFDDGCCDEHIELMMHESRHHLFEFLFTHLPMSDTDASFRADLLHKIRE